MKYLLSKEPYWYKIHTLLMKSSAYSLLLSTLSYMDYPHSSFTEKILSPFHSMIFQKF